MALPKRKLIRLSDYDYNNPGYYFITMCTKDKKKLLCDIVGTDILGGPDVRFTCCGEIARTQLEAMADFYTDIRLDKYVIMPNHIHLILQIIDCGNGPSRRPVPTNSKIAHYIGTFKRFCNRKFGKNIWQYRSHDHIIRGERE